MISTGRGNSMTVGARVIEKKEDGVKRGLSFLMGVILLLTSYGCVVEHRHDEHRGDHEQYREHEQQRDGYHEGDSDEYRGGDEQRDYNQH
jgi:hypothetical protein